MEISVIAGMQRTSVDFPAPLSPTSPTTSPGQTSRLMSSSACRPPKVLRSEVMRRSGSVALATQFTPPAGAG